MKPLGHLLAALLLGTLALTAAGASFGAHTSDVRALFLVCCVLAALYAFCLFGVAG